MSGPTFICPNCGAKNGIDGMEEMGPTAMIRFVGIALACWKCDGNIPLDGTVRGNQFWPAFGRRSRADVETFQQVTQAVSKGELDAVDAIAQAAGIDPEFAKWLKLAVNLGAWGITTLLAVITIYLQIKIAAGDDEDTARQLRLENQQLHVMERMLEEMQRPTGPPEETPPPIQTLSTPQTTRTRTPSPSTPQAPAAETAGNRRSKRAASSRRHGRGPARL